MPGCSNTVRRSVATQAAGGQGSQKRQPAGAVLAGGDVEAEDLAVAHHTDITIPNSRGQGASSESKRPIVPRRGTAVPAAEVVR